MSIKKFLLIAGILGIIRIALSFLLPIYAISTAGVDDRLMVMDAQYISRLQWLGEYNQYVLTKGIGFPVFLAVLYRLHIPYIPGVTLFYAVACVCMVLSLRPLISKTWIAVLFYLLLLFSPAMFELQIVQRVYRNSLTPGQVLLLFAGFFGMYLRYKESLKHYLWWCLLTCFAFPFFWMTREDSIWILPFLIVYLIIITILLIRDKKSILKNRIIKFGMTVLPLFALLSLQQIVGLTNLFCYDAKIVNELNEGSFSDALKAIYAADVVDELPQYVTVSLEKLEKLYEHSPTLKSIQPQLEEMRAFWASADRHPEDNEIEDGQFFWYLRDAAAGAGHHKSLITAENFYRNIAEELNDAYEQGRIKRGITMPSALMSPIRNEYLAELPNAIMRGITYTITYENISAEAYNSISDGAAGLALFEHISRGGILTPETDSEIRVNWKNRISGINYVVKGYQFFAIPMALLAAISFLTMLALSVSKKRFRTELIFNELLLVTAVLLSYLVLIAGLSYSDISAFQSIVPSYAAGTYPLILLFELLAPYLLWKNYLATGKKGNANERINDFNALPK